MIRILGLSFVFGASLLACATDSNSTAPGDDELAGEHDDGEQAKADGVDTFGFMTAQKVGAHECNGLGSCTHVALARANRATTKCADDSYQASCDVHYLDFSALGLSASKLGTVMAKLQASAGTPEIGPQLLVRGSYVHGTNPIYPNMDWVTFKVSEVWLAQIGDGNLDGTFVDITDNGNRCFEPPCHAERETRLNSTRFVDIDGLDWPDRPASVMTAIADGTGAIVVGDRTHGKIMGLPTTLRSVNEVFLKVK